MVADISSVNVCLIDRRLFLYIKVCPLIIVTFIINFVSYFSPI